MNEMKSEDPLPSFPPAASSANIPPAGESAKPSRRRLLRAAVLLYAGAVVAALVLLWKSASPEAERPLSFAPAKHLLTASHESVVGWVSIHGTIYQNDSGRVWESGMEQWRRRIESLANKSEVKAIVLDINSPGGSVGAVQELYDVIERTRKEKKKPVIALVGDVAASGGYYLASACDKVVAHPGSLLGSIGVIFDTINAEDLLKKIGVKAEPIKSGKLKDIGSPTRAMTSEERTLLQGIIDNAYGQFLAAVAQGRGLPVETLRPLADGRVFTGQQALGLGLVDTLGGSHEAVLLAGKLGGIPGTPKVLRDAESLESILDLLNSSLATWLRPKSSSMFETPSWVSSGMEYRWIGFH